MAKERINVYLTLGPGKFSYLNILAPRAYQQKGDEAYSFDFVFPKSDLNTTDKVRKAEKDIIAQATDKKAITKLPKDLGDKFTNCLKDGDKKLDSQGNQDEVYKGSWYIKCTCKAHIIDQKTNKEKLPPAILIKDLGRQDQRNNPQISDLIWSGMEGYCSLNFSFWGDNSKCGISAYIQSIIKTGDGTRIGNRHDSADDYADIYEAQDAELTSGAPAAKEDDLGI